MPEQMEVRTAVDTYMLVRAYFDLSPISAKKTNWKANAKELHNFLKNKSSIQFYDALKECFEAKKMSCVEKENHGDKNGTNTNST